MKLFFTYLFFVLCSAAPAQKTFDKLRAMMHREQYGPLMKIIDSCIVKDHEKDSALYYKGLILLKQKRTKDAHKTWKELVKTFPDFREAHYLGALISFTEEDYGRAIDEFSYIIKRNPDHLGALYNRSIAFGILEDYLYAIEDLDACIKLDPDNPSYYYSKAYWYEYTGNYPEAEIAYKRTISLDPKNYDSYFGLAFIYQMQNEPGKACDMINNAISSGSQIAEELKLSFCH